MALGSAAALKRFRASPAAGTQAAPAVPLRPSILTLARTYICQVSAFLSKYFNQIGRTRHTRTFRPNAVAAKRLALLGTEGARCTEVAAPAAPSPELLRLCGLPAGAAAPAVRAALNTPNAYGDLPIHRALRDEAPGPELVRAMLDAGGDAMLAVPGQFKCLPLHRAAGDSRSPAVVALLLARGPAGSSQGATDRGFRGLT